MKTSQGYSFRTDVLPRFHQDYTILDYQAADKKRPVLKDKGGSKNSLFATANADKHTLIFNSCMERIALRPCAKPDAPVVSTAVDYLLFPERHCP
jgi:hypothetical protein